MEEKQQQLLLLLLLLLLLSQKGAAWDDEDDLGIVMYTDEKVGIPMLRVCSGEASLIFAVALLWSYWRWLEIHGYYGTGYSTKT